MSISKNGFPITNLAEWQEHAGPKKSGQWSEDRSAVEVAKAWLDAGPGILPHEVSSLLAKNSSFGSVESWEAEPEVKLPFDKFGGEPRNTDLLVKVTDSHGTFLIGVEAKSDETFADTVSKTLCNALERKLKSPNSNGIERVEQLAEALFGSRQKGESSVGGVRYQLMTACAGILCEGERQGCERVMMLVHEFATKKTRNEKLERNSKDMDRFLARLSHGKVTTLKSGEIVGPFGVPGAPLISAKVKLYIGKVTCDLRR
jgi:hypothetical protein